MPDTLYAAGNPHVVLAHVYVQNGTVTIEPGVELSFTADTGFSLYSSGHLSAVGTQNEPIKIGFVGVSSPIAVAIYACLPYNISRNHRV